MDCWKLSNLSRILDYWSIIILNCSCSWLICYWFCISRDDLLSPINGYCYLLGESTLFFWLFGLRFIVLPKLAIPWFWVSAAASIWDIHGIVLLFLNLARFAASSSFYFRWLSASLIHAILPSYLLSLFVPALSSTADRPFEVFIWLLSSTWEGSYASCSRMRIASSYSC